MKWPRILTERDNVTPCPARLLMVCAVAVYHGLVGYALVGQHLVLTFDSLGQYLGHMSMAVGTVAGAIGVKSALKGDSP